MEKREILIASTRAQKQYKVNTDATTLAELKAALNANEDVIVKTSDGSWVPNTTPIDYEGLDFTESITRTQLVSDDSQLPQNVNYKGQTTNNLVMLLTNTRKNVASGAGDRKEAYAIIKEHNLQKDIEEEFGYNYTNVATADLWEFINDNVDFDIEPDYDEEDDTYEDGEQKEYVPTGEDLIISLFDFLKLCYKADAVALKDMELFAELVTDYIKMAKECETDDDLIKVGNIEVSLKEEMEKI